MEFTIKTETLQEMVGKVIKCASNNKLIPITSLLSIKVDNHLLLTTTDATNYFYVKSATPVECEPFEVSVLADTFAKLIQKTTSENVTIKYDETALKLVVVGNGNYTIELPLDENGKPIKFPVANIDLKVACGTLKTSVIKEALSYNKVALGEGTTYPFLSHYYCGGDKIITTNQIKVCETNEKTFDVPKVLSQQVMELLGVVSGENIEVYSMDNKLIFETENDRIINNLMAKPDDFPVANIQALIDSSFEAKCTISKDVVLNILDRLSLFMSSYDNKGIDLYVSNNGITLKTIAGSGVEVVPFISAENTKDYSCRVNIEIFRSLLATYEIDNVDFYYGNPRAIKLSAGKVIQLAALMEV